jgi:hypothetical protein
VRSGADECGKFCAKFMQRVPSDWAEPTLANAKVVILDGKRAVPPVPESIFSAQLELAA